MRYLGSKESLTEPIIQLLADKNLLRKELVFFDAFCGMGAVSDAIKTSYDHIVLNDSLKCSLTFALGKIFDPPYTQKQYGTQYHLLETLNYERPHQSLANFTPASFYGNKEKKVG